MGADIFTELSWLPKPPPTFRQACREAGRSGGDVGADLRRLATHALNTAQLGSLGARLCALRQDGTALHALSSFRLGVLGNGTLDLLLPALIGTALRHGIALECVSSPYGQFVQDALSPISAVNKGACDAVLLALDYRAFGFEPVPGDKDAADAQVGAAIGLLDRMRASLGAAGAICILQTVAPPVEAMFGSSDRLIPGTFRWLIDRFNARLLESLAGSHDILLDVAAVAETVGAAEWHSPSQWMLAKLPVADLHVPLYADHVGRVLGAMRGRARRCLVLDLDNTLWGGVVGDDGLGGIQLAEGDATGEAFRTVQRLALHLRGRGIVLAVSSKNDDGVARAVFRDHPEMLIREHHIAAFQANWNDKAQNIRLISQTLSLGLDAMVFLDDNPMERDLVRTMLPEVAVPELPADPALYARTLAAAGYFESSTFSAEDLRRAAYYQADARRLELQKQAGGLEDYLASLDMEIAFQPFDRANRARITQLINKSNQFNLTTRRYSEAEVEKAEHDPEVFTLQVRLVDRLGDNGMISVVICRPAQASAWEVDTWLMSCRVLGRGVERMVLAEVLAQARARGVTRLIGLFRPTARNAMVRDHYRSLGFSALAEVEGGDTRWIMDTDTQIEAVAMRVRRGAEPQAGRAVHPVLDLGASVAAGAL